MPWGTLKDIGKKAYGKAKEADSKMVEAHSDDDAGFDDFVGGPRENGDGPGIDLGIEDPSTAGNGDRYENDPSFPFGEDREADEPGKIMGRESMDGPDEDDFPPLF